MPMCDEGRFDRQGIAEAFEMPSAKVGRLIGGRAAMIGLVMPDQSFLLQLEVRAGQIDAP